MRDREIVAAIVAGDPAGLAAAYDTYAAALHRYCRSLLAEPADAADAVQDTFVIAAAKLAGLRDPDRLRPWLYAVARNECHRKLRSLARFAALEEGGEMTDAADGRVAGGRAAGGRVADGTISADTAADAADRAGLRELIAAAIAGLNPGDREVIELSLRHDLDGSDLADALGLPPNQAHALASRARRQLERSLGAVLVARTGRRSCPELGEILAGWDGTLTVLLRKRVSRHVEQCEICGERKRRELSPAMLFSVLPLIALPPGLRHQVVRLVSDVSPDAVRYRALVVSRAGQFGPAGFPVPLSPAGRARGRHLRLPAPVYLTAAAVLLILAIIGVPAAYWLSHDHEAASLRGAPVTVTVTATPSASAPSAGASPARTPPGPAATTPLPTAPSATQPVVVVTPARTPSPSPSAKPSATPTPIPTLSPGALELSTQTLRLPETAPYTGSFSLTADGGPVSFSISVPAAEQSYLTLTPASGTLKAGQSQVITVTVTPPPNGPEPPSVSTAEVDPGAQTLTIEFTPRVS